MFKSIWTTCSIIDNHSRLNIHIIGGGGGRQYMNELFYTHVFLFSFLIANWLAISRQGYEIQIEATIAFLIILEDCMNILIIMNFSCSHLMVI